MTPTTPDTTAPNRTPRQDEILDAALALVREEGWSSLTIRRLAERVGVTDPALYRHFRTKSDIVLGLIDRIEGMLHGPVRAIAADVSLPARTRLLHILEHHVEMVLATDGLPLLLVAEAAASADPALPQRLGQLLGEYLGILSALVAAHQGSLPAGSQRVTTAAPPPSSAEVATLLLGIPVVMAIRCRVIPGSRPDREAARRLVRHALGQLLDHDGASPLATSLGESS